MTHLDILIGIAFVIGMVSLAYTHKPPKGGCGCRM